MSVKVCMNETCKAKKEVLSEDDNSTVIKISDNDGRYDNGSKFASAFRDVKGVTPNEYRNLNCKRKTE